MLRGHSSPSGTEWQGLGVAVKRIKGGKMNSKAADVDRCNGGREGGQPGNSLVSGLCCKCCRSTRLRNDMFLNP